VYLRAPRKEKKTGTQNALVHKPSLPSITRSSAEWDIVPWAQDGQDEKHEERHVPLQEPPPPVQPGSPLPFSYSLDEELFKNPFLRRSANSRPFFSCEEDLEGWTKDIWIQEQAHSKFVKALVSKLDTQPALKDLHVLSEGIWHKKADSVKSSHSKHRIIKRTRKSASIRHWTAPQYRARRSSRSSENNPHDLQ